MSRTSILIILGTISILAPFVGLPVGLWKFLEVASGLGVLALALSMRVKDAPREQAPMPTVVE